MTSDRIQPFLDETRINSRKFTQRNTSLFIHNNQFCFIWKSQNNSFNQVIENELNFKNVDNVISDTHLKVLLNMNKNLKKFHSHITSVIVYDIETFNTDKVFPYANCIYGLTKTSGKNNRDITEREYKKT